MARYPWDLLPRLTLQIEHGQTEQMSQSLEALLRVLYRSHRTLTLRKFRCVQVISHCLRGARKGGASSDALLDEHARKLERLATLRSWTSVKQFMQDYVLEIAETVRQSSRAPADQVVRRILKHMKSSLKTPHTLSQYAHQAGMSREHLSRRFSALVGVSFQEELRRIRIQRACEHLKASDWKIGVVAREVGYASTSQFILEFRKATAITPGMFRNINRDRMTVR